MVQYGRPSRSSWNLYGHPLTGLLKGNLRKSWCNTVGRKFPIGNAYQKKGCSCLCMDDIKLSGKKQNINPMWKVFNKEVHLSLTCMWDSMTKWNKAKILLTITEPCLNPEFLQQQLKNYHTRKIWVFLRGLLIWRVMPRNAWNEIVSWRIKRIKTLQSINSLHWPPSFQRRRIEIRQRIAKSILSNCSEILIVDTFLEYPIFYGHWTNLHDRSQNGPTRVINDNLEWSLTEIIHVTTNNLSCGKQCKTMQIGTVSRLRFCRRSWGLKKSTSGGTLCVFGSHTFVPINWMCKKQTSVSQSLTSTESEIISLDTGLRLNGIPALDLWIWSSQFFTTRIRMIKNWEICTNLKRERKFMERLVTQTMLILFPQTCILLIRKLCCMCLKSTRQWSKWL